MDRVRFGPARQPGCVRDARRGGEAERLTWHSADDLPSDFTPDDAAVIFESNRTDDVNSTLFPSGVVELYRVPVAGGMPTWC